MKRIILIASILILFVFGAWALTLILLWYDGKEGIGEIGQFGDMFGSTNALFSGLAFVGIIITIIIQSRELELQRQELKETKNIFKQQSNQLIFQQKENTFFNLLEHHNKIILGIEEKESEGSGKQKETIILSGYKSFTSIWGKTKRDLKYFQEGDTNRREFDSSSLNRNHPWRSLSSHYSYKQIYNSILHILEFVQSNLDDNVFYYKTLYNSISEDEREVISILNEYHEYMDVEKFDFSSYPIKFDAQIHHKNWFLSPLNSPPLVQIGVDSVQIPEPAEGEKDYSVMGKMSFENDVYIKEMGVSLNGEKIQVISTFEKYLKKHQILTFSVNQETILEIEKETPPIEVLKQTNKPDSRKLYFTVLFNEMEFTIALRINAFKTNTGTNIHFN